MNYCRMQLTQLSLIILRICFLCYLIIKTTVNKYELHQSFNESTILEDMEEDKKYTISVMTLTLLLMISIAFTFVYNYFIVHENFVGVVVMIVFLGFSLVVTVVQSFDESSLLETLIVNLASVLEMSLAIILTFFIRTKRKEKYIKSFEKRFSTFV